MTATRLTGRGDLERLLRVRTRTGAETHLAWSLGSTTRCGIWLRAQASARATDRPVTCEHCLASAEASLESAGRTPARRA